MKKMVLNTIRIILIILTIFISIIVTNRITIKEVESKKEQLSAGENNFITTSEHLAQMAQNNGKKIIYLGIGTSFDVSNYEGYNNFTADNFIVEANEGENPRGNFSCDTGLTGYSLSATKSYDASTGILKSYVSLGLWGSYQGNYVQLSKSLNVKAYLIL